MEIPFLYDDTTAFPDVFEAIEERDGFVAIGGSLSAQRLLTAYKQGIFPWFSEGDPVCWWALSPRTVLYPEKCHIGRSLQKTLRNKPYLVTVNQNFPAVIAACAGVRRPGQSGTWITEEMQQAYIGLHELGHAHSFECWYPDENGVLNLAGGLYGVQIGRVFFGESMFALRPDASKIAFACAVPYMVECGIEIIDCQQNTDHLARFGSELIAFETFQTALNDLTDKALDKPIGSGWIAQSKIVLEGPSE
ncbi:leucyl/phenylalanyl-tRNA--protein transferase [Neisseria montereyensis]|uniref:Leucyl/phenylalanyl-tRNA--protein transferase n=1 Tax=Neisseria montereyensis TaxID=2973938 RepID=A0ABT2FBK8_9NEIS|nr:leucyl/phenylalanyl-tRNA--protein transferase [Neisseria montereyensis]MCS4533574.1 leucyl/phenylalanyl-tRNA--protein transferase [Neisseria montereyensis]